MSCPGHDVPLRISEANNTTVTAEAVVNDWKSGRAD